MKVYIAIFRAWQGQKVKVFKKLERAEKWIAEEIEKEKKNFPHLKKFHYQIFQGEYLTKKR